MNRIQKFSKNALSAAIYQLIVMAAGFITPPLMIAVYGSEMNGLIASIGQITSYLSLVEAGIGGAAIYSLYKPLADGNTGRVNRVLAAARRHYLCAGYVFASASLILSAAYALLRGNQEISGGMIFALAVLLSINGCMDFFLVAKYRVILTADQRSYMINAASALYTIARMTVVIVCAACGADIIWLHTAAIIPILLKAALILFYCRKCYPYLAEKAQPDESALGRRFDVVYQQILNSVQLGAPAMIAALMLDWSAVSIYSVYSMIIGAVNGMAVIFTSGIPAAFGELLAKGKKDTLRRTYSQYETVFCCLICVLYGLTLALILPFVSVYARNFTDAEYYHPLLAMLIAVNGLTYTINFPQSMMVTAAGMYRETRHRATCQGIIILAGGLLLVRIWGLPGIVIASIASNLYRTIDLIHFVPKYILSGTGRKSAVCAAKTIGMAAIIAAPSALIRFNPSGYGQWTGYAFLYGLLAVAYAGGIWYLTDRENMKAVVKRISAVFASLKKIR